MIEISDEIQNRLMSLLAVKELHYACFGRGQWTPMFKLKFAAIFCCYLVVWMFPMLAMGVQSDDVVFFLCMILMLAPVVFVALRLTRVYWIVVADAGQFVVSHKMFGRQNIGLDKHRLSANALVTKFGTMSKPCLKIKDGSFVARIQFGVTGLKSGMAEFEEVCSLLGLHD